ncbi:MAG TPA: FecR domain-containing protein [Mesorhizobium sp.]|nr:FecR domain-containing protein [Mesorhizobium sp.]
MRRRSIPGAGLAAFAAALLSSAAPIFAEPIPRQGAAAGAVIARKIGEEARFIEIGRFQTVDLQQDLLPGDVLRTNVAGALAILFSDRTQIRLGRNSTLLVRAIGGGSADTELELQEGELWARAERGGEGVTVDTPAAAAAVRGTDWSLKVEGERTSLVVLEGAVELFNPQGSVTVAEGEAAVATIGSAPSKLVIVDPDDREQMLFHLPLRNAFNFLPASPLPSRNIRGERLRIEALPEASRSAEDRVTLAETALSFAGREAARNAIASARELPLSPAQEARLELVQALIAGAEGRHAEAAEMFARAMPRLDPQRRAVARYAGYFSRGLADPSLAENPPATPDGGAYAAIAAAWTAGFLQDIPAAIAVVREAEARYPDESTLPAVRAQLALLIDDREQAREAYGRALALDPDDATALEARSLYRAGIESDLDGALSDISRAAEIAPGSTTIWNQLGLVQSARGADREAEEALKRAIELDPQDPTSRANLAILYLDQDRLAEAAAQIELAMAVDPEFDVMLVARGRHRLQTGELDAGVQDLLAGTTANPAYAQALLLLAAGHYESGNRDAAEQALENADRLDPNDPVTSSFATAVAIDDYDADRAIASAQEALRRSRARGGDYQPLSANRAAGSTLNEAYRLQGLDAWGRYYGAAVFDPFTATGFIDQFVSGSPDPFVNDLDFGGVPTEPTFNNAGFSSFFQGLLLDPAILAGRSRGANLLRRPFIEGAIGAGFVASEGGDAGWTANAEVQGFAATPFPVSFYGTFTGREAEESREGFYPGGPSDLDIAFTLGDEDFSGTGYIAAKPTPVDRVVAYVDARQDVDDILDGAFTVKPGAFFGAPEVPGIGVLPILLNGLEYDREVEDRSLTSGLAWSHTFGYRNVASAGVFVSGFERSSVESGMLDLDAVILTPGDPVLVPLGGTQDIEAEFNQNATIAALSHSIGVGDATFRYGVEGGRVRQEERETSVTSLIDPTTGLEIALPAEESDTDVELTAARPYLDVIYELSPTLTAEVGLFGAFLRSEEITVNGVEAGELSIERLEPRLGLAWEPMPGQWLRVGYLRESGAFSAASLAPVGVVGLQSNQLPLAVTGFSDTLAARWDAEWTNRFFTSVDFQHQEFEDLNIPVPGGIATDDLEEGRLDRLAGTANYHLGGGLGLFGTLVYTDSEGVAATDAAGDCVCVDALPFVPEWSGRLGVTYVNPANLKLTLAATYVGERLGGLSGDVLDDYWTADAFLTWEPFDKRFALELAGYNLTGEDFDVATSTPGWSRTFTGSLKVRF